jgi:cysteinyl-tRNA synthetase
MDRERQQRLRSLEAEHSTAQKLLADEHQRRLANISEEHDERIAASEEALAKTRKEWKAAIAAAKKKREAAEAGEPPAPGELEFDPRKIQDMLSGVGAAARQNLSVTGTFSAVAAWGLGTGNAMDRTARATEQTAKNTRRLLDEVRGNEMAFT